MYQAKYMKYKTKYLQAKAIKDNNQSGSGPGLQDVAGATCKWVCGAAAKVASFSSVTNCDAYYNKNREGKYTTYYEFQSMDQLNDFVRYVYMKTYEYNQGTLLYEKETFKDCKSESKLPELVKLLLESKMSKAKILELLFSKQDVEKYTGMLNKTYKAQTVKDQAIVSFIETVPQHVINSIKNILYIDEKSSTENIWDDYSILLSFVACFLDSTVVTEALNIFYKMPIEKIKQKIEELNLPVTFVFLDLLVDKKFNEISRNLNNLYEDNAKNKNINFEKKIIGREAEYKKINDFTINDFFDPKKNTLFCLPPSVLFMLLIKINPNINKNDNKWNKMLKQGVESLNVKCGPESSSTPHIMHDKEINPEEEKKRKEEEEKRKKELASHQETISKLKKDIEKDPCAKNVIFKIDFNKIMGKKNDCGKYYNDISEIKKLKANIDDIKKTSAIRRPNVIEKAAMNAFMKAADVDIITNAICKNMIEWDIFDKFLKHILATSNVFSKLTGSSWNTFLVHAVIQQIAGFITYLPIDLKKILHLALHIKSGDVQKFDDIYDIYRVKLYKNFTEKKDDNYYLDKKNEKTMYPLFPPKELLDQIKQSVT